MKHVLGFVFAVAVSGLPSAGAWAEDTMTMAVNLGSVLASEKACGLTFDHIAIERWIEQHVPADDMSFPSRLNMITQGSQIQIDEMSKSSLAAHCSQIIRIARSFSFID